MFKHRYAWLAGTALAFLQGCGDTCQPPPFTSTAQLSTSGSATQPTAVVTFNQSTETMFQNASSYFGMVRLAPSAPTEVSALVASVTNSGTLQATIRLRDLASYAASHTSIVVPLQFPDTRGAYTSCVHQGTDDAYGLNVTFTLNAAGEATAVTTTSIIRTVTGAI